MNLADDFKREVVDDFVSEYANGRTPNPCVRCNGIVRFDKMLELATDLGATHPRHRPLRADHQRRPRAAAHRLCRAAQGPDLHARPPGPGDARARLVPARRGDREGSRSASSRDERSSSVADKPDSQDLCFLAGVGKDRLLERQGVRSDPGQIVAEDGTVLGDHDGQHAFTVGQRRGLKIDSPELRCT